jgi:voltage-gated potassium channel Kch
MKTTLTMVGSAVLAVALAVMVIGIGEDGADGKDGVGALSSPDIHSKYLKVGGVERAYEYAPSLIQSTTTVICSIPSPSATSTLVSGGINVTVASTTGTTPVTITNSSLPNTFGSEQIAIASVSEDVGFFLEAASSTYNAASLADRVFKPNTYFVVTQTGGGLLTQTGTCQATFEVYR